VLDDLNNIRPISESLQKHLTPVCLLAAC